MISKVLDASRRHLLTKPRGNGNGIKPNRTSDLETWNPVRRHEFVHLALGDAQEFCDVRDDERVPLPFEAICEGATFLRDAIPRHLFR